MLPLVIIIQILTLCFFAYIQYECFEYDSYFFLNLESYEGDLSFFYFDILAAVSSIWAIGYFLIKSAQTNFNKLSLVFAKLLLLCFFAFEQYWCFENDSYFFLNLGSYEGNLNYFYYDVLIAVSTILVIIYLLSTNTNTLSYSIDIVESSTLNDDDSTHQVAGSGIKQKSMSHGNIKEWLLSIGLDQYSECFTSNDIEFAQLNSLTDNDLKEIGIDSFGHRKAIIESVSATINKEKELIDSERLEKLKSKSNKLIGFYFLSTVVLEVFLISVDVDPGLCLLAGLGLFIYFLPTFLAFRNGHKFRWAIFAANLFLGATILVWIVLLLYSINLLSGKEAAAAAVAAKAYEMQNRKR